MIDPEAGRDWGPRSPPIDNRGFFFCTSLQECRQVVSFLSSSPYRSSFVVCGSALVSPAPRSFQLKHLLSSRCLRVSTILSVRSPIFESPGFSPPNADGALSGPLMLAMVSTVYFYGINCVQAFDYYVNFPEELGKGNWWLVTVLMILNTLHTIHNVYVAFFFHLGHFLLFLTSFSCVANSEPVYYWCVTNFANPAILASATTPIILG